MYTITVKRNDTVLVNFETRGTRISLDLRKYIKAERDRFEPFKIPKDTPRDILDIINAVKKRTGMKDPFLKTNRFEYKRARQYIFFMACMMYSNNNLPRFNKYTKANIGRWCGGKCHATVIHSCKVILTEMMYKDTRSMVYKIAIDLNYLNNLRTKLKN